MSAAGRESVEDGVWHLPSRRGRAAADRHSGGAARGGDFYARGHIRAIARAAGADPEALVAEYDASHGTPPTSAAAALAAPPVPIRLRRRRRRRRPNWSIVLLVALAAAAGLLAYHLLAIPAH